MLRRALGSRVVPGRVPPFATGLIPPFATGLIPPLAIVHPIPPFAKGGLGGISPNQGGNANS